MKYAFLVILYNKRLQDSVTIRTLMDWYESLSDFDKTTINITVINNGPECISSESHSEGIELFNYIENKPLSKLYNNFLNMNSFDYGVLLDDDSTLTRNYLDAVTSFNGDVGLPILKYKNQIISPLISGKVIRTTLKSKDKLLAAGSGLVLSNSFANEIKDEFNTIFDESFALYGVDTSLFLRMRILGFIDRVDIIEGFEHSFSKMTEESSDINHFRNVERSYEFGLMLRHYISFGLVIKFFVTVLKAVSGKSRFSLLSIVKTIFLGKHPRC